MESLGGQVGQDAMQGMGAGPMDGRPNMLASIQSYLNRLQQEPNPPVLLPSLSYPPGQGELAIGCQVLHCLFCHCAKWQDSVFVAVMAILTATASILCDKLSWYLCFWASTCWLVVVTCRMI